MKIAKVYINETNAHTISCKDIPKGIRGGEVELEYAKGVWDGLIRNVVFTNGRETVPVVNAGELVEIPAEVTDVQNALVRVGVCGIGAEGKIVIPTLWTDLRRVSDAVPVDAMPGTDPALPVWAQMLQKMGDLNALETEDKASLVAAVNELAQAKATSCLLGDDDTLDGLVENGRYYLAGGTDNLLIRQMLREAGVPVPEEMNAEGIFARAMFVDVTRVEGVSAGPDDPVGQPCQHLAAYFDLEKGDGTWVYEFHRVHDFTGSHPDGSAWGVWITATKNHLEVEPEIVTFRYGEATLEQIRQAKLAGKIVFATDGVNFLPLIGVAEVRAVFSSFSDGVNRRFVVTGFGWEDVSDKYLKEDEIQQTFVAEYGVTTMEELIAELRGGKTCIMRDGNTEALMVQGSEAAQYFLFAVHTGHVVMCYVLEAAGWRNYQVFFGKTTAIDERSSHDEIPTAQAVWDLAEKKLDADKLPEAVEEALAQAKASGEFDGAPGPPGEAGTENLMVVNVRMPGMSADKTHAEITAAYSALKGIIAFYNGRVFAVSGRDPGGIYFNECISDPARVGKLVCKSTDVWEYTAAELPSTVTDDHINSLIDAKLGVIENGSY